MKPMVILLALTLPVAAARSADERSGLTLAEVQPFSPSTVTATGRIQPLVCARIGARVSGTLAELGKDASGAALDAGMTVKAGDVLFRLDETTFRNSLAVSEAALKSAQAALANLTAGTRDERLEQLRQAVAELDARLADRQREEQRFRRLVEQEKTLPATRLEEVQTELAVLKTQHKAAQARLAEAENGPTKTEVAMLDARVKEVQAALKIAQDDLRDATVRAPFEGELTRRFKSPGDYLTSTPHTEVFELVATDKLEAELRLPESYLDMVQAGKTAVTLHSPLLKGDLKLPVGRVVSVVEAGVGTFSVRVPIPPDRRGRLTAGGFVTADVALERASQAVIVPLRAIVQREGQSVVFLARQGKMVRQSVDVGDRLTESAVVKSGLSAGQKVVVGPAEALQDGAPLPDNLRKPD